MKFKHKNEERNLKCVEGTSGHDLNVDSHAHLYIFVIIVQPELSLGCHQRIFSLYYDSEARCDEFSFRDWTKSPNKMIADIISSLKVSVLCAVIIFNYLTQLSKALKQLTSIKSISPIMNVPREI